MDNADPKGDTRQKPPMRLSGDREEVREHHSVEPDDRNVRMRILSCIFLVMFGILPMGCGLFPQEQLNGWKGVHREELIRVMGTPTKETPLPDGGQRLEFIQRITRHPLGGEVYGTSYECHKTFDLDAEGVIQKAVSETPC